MLYDGSSPYCDISFAATGLDILANQGPAAAGALLQSVEGGLLYFSPPSLWNPPLVCCKGNQYTFILTQGTQYPWQYVSEFLESDSIALTGMGPMKTVNRYFWSCANSLAPGLNAFLTANLPFSNVYVWAGHSLGAAVNLCLRRLLTTFPLVREYQVTFGQPRVGNANFVNAIVAGQVTWYRLVNLGDPIPSLPPSSWAGPGSLYPVPGPGAPSSYADGGTCLGLDSSGYLNFCPGLLSTIAILALMPIKSFNSHLIQQYSKSARLGCPQGWYGALQSPAAAQAKVAVNLPVSLKILADTPCLYAPGCSF